MLRGEEQDIFQRMGSVISSGIRSLYPRSRGFSLFFSKEIEQRTGDNELYVWIVLKRTRQPTSLTCFQAMAPFKGKVSTILQLLVDFTSG